jgi:hypothetical protein
MFCICISVDFFTFFFLLEICFQAKLQAHYASFYQICIIHRFCAWVNGNCCNMYIEQKNLNYLLSQFILCNSENSINQILN